MWKVYLIAAAFALYAFWMIDYANIRQENKTLSASLKTANRSIAALDSVAMHEMDLRTKEGILIDEIRKSPKEHDAPSAPVLLDAIERLRE